MLGTRDATATIAVKDLEVAKKFYEGTLGLKRVDAMEPEAHVYKSGNTRVLIYRSQYAGTNKATALSWSVGNEVEALVQALKAKGITFEKYDLPGSTLKGDVHVMGDIRAAWFKDPDGNILNLVNK